MNVIFGGLHNNFILKLDIFTNVGCYDLVTYCLKFNNDRQGVFTMFKNKAGDGRNNICGENVYALRKLCVPKMSQRILAEKLQINGIDVDKNAVQRIESGERFVTDIELAVLAKIFDVTVDELLKPIDR